MYIQYEYFTLYIIKKCVLHKKKDYTQINKIEEYTVQSHTM